MSDAALADFFIVIGWQIARRAIGDPELLRLVAAPPQGDDGLWHYAAYRGRTDVCEYLKSKGLLDLVDRRNCDGCTPLHIALLSSRGNQETARWMVDNGADIHAVNDDDNSTTFRCACVKMDLAFVEELAGQVPPDHLTICDCYGDSPLRTGE